MSVSSERADKLRRRCHCFNRASGGIAAPSVLQGQIQDIIVSVEESDVVVARNCCMLVTAYCAGALLIQGVLTGVHWHSCGPTAYVTLESCLER